MKQEVTSPATPPRPPPAAETHTRSTPRLGERAAGRLEALATPRVALMVGALAALAAIALFFVRPTYPNYDSYYTLIWGQELAAGRLPDYDVVRTPTPHPLATLVAAALSPLGGAADRTLVLLSLAFHLILLGLLFRFTQLLLGTLVAVLAAAVLLTRTDLEFFTLRAMVDVPFLALVFGAAVLELSRPRRGAAVLGLLALAGLLRPEAWVLAGLYVLWLAPSTTRAGFVRYAALAAVGPLCWALADLLVTGNPLYSLTSTREVAGQFGRQRTPLEALLLLPDFLGGNEKIVNVAAGGLGGLLALHLLRRRAALPLALALIGIAVFLAIAGVGLSVIPRYLLIPSLVFNLCVACALGGFTLARSGRARLVGGALAVLTLALVAFRAPAYLSDAAKLNGQAVFVREQHAKLKSILDHPEVVPLLGSCGPITVPTHSAIPVVRYETGLGKEALEASIAQRRPPVRGLLLVGRTFNFEPGAARSTTGTASPTSARRWWSNYPLSDFRPVARNDRWSVYARCT
ncbi:MAG: hypothetical protein ACR2NV_14030 [Thermoleophilaceae bacterium]